MVNDRSGGRDRSRVPARRQASRGDDWIQQADPACCRHLHQSSRIGADPGSLSDAASASVRPGRCKRRATGKGTDCRRARDAGRRCTARPDHMPAWVTSSRIQCCSASGCIRKAPWARVRRLRSVAVRFPRAYVQPIRVRPPAAQCEWRLALSGQTTNFKRAPALRPLDLHAPHRGSGVASALSFHRSPAL